MGGAARSGKAKDWFMGDGATAQAQLGEVVGQVIQWAQMTSDDVIFIVSMSFELR